MAGHEREGKCLGGESARKSPINSGVLARKVFGILLACTAIFICVFILAACNGEDPFQPTADVLLVLNNGEKNVKWSVGQEVLTPTKDGCVFLYWCEDIECEIKSDFAFDKMPSESLVLYAKWAELAEIEGVVFMDKTVIYDGAVHTIYASGIPSGASVAYSGGDKTDAGEYTVNVAVSMDGYKTLELSATLTIQRASIGEIVFEDAVVDWDGNEHSIYIETALPVGVTVSYEGNGKTDAGEHTVTAIFDVGNNYESIEPMSAVLTIREKYYTVTFNDGTMQTERQVGHGKGVENIPEVTPKRGYDGRWEDVNLSCVTEDMEINAEYSLSQYAVRYESNGGDDIADGNYTMLSGYTYKIPSREHYIFVCWCSDVTLVEDAGECIEEGEIGNRVVYAKWRAKEYTVTYHMNGGINDQDNKENATYTIESEEYEYNPPMQAGKTFAGWYDNPDFTGEPITKREKGSYGDIDLYAKWI